MKATGPDDPIKTVVTSMAAVLTTAMTLRIILSVKGSLEYGGGYALSVGSTGASSRTTHVLSGARSGNLPTNVSAHNTHTYTLDDLRSKPEAEWGTDGDAKSSMPDDETVIKDGYTPGPNRGESNGVKITINREIGYDDRAPYGKWSFPAFVPLTGAAFGKTWTTLAWWGIKLVDHS